METAPEDTKYNKNFDFSDTNVLLRTPFRQRRSTIIVTLSDPEITRVDIQAMMEAGINIARIKTTHTTKEATVKLLGKVDKSAMTLSRRHGLLDWPIATAVELKACIVKTGKLETETEDVLLTEGKQIILTNDTKEYNNCNKHQIFVDNPFLTKDVKVGVEIIIANNEIILKCMKTIDEISIKCVIVKGGKLESMCAVYARSSEDRKPIVTRKDLQVVKFALQYQVDMIIINYARHAHTLKKVKKYIGKKVKRPIIICGISCPEDISNVDDLIKESDGIIFSREFLTYELGETQKYQIHQIQKWIGAKCQQAGKPYYIGGVFQETLINGKFCPNEISDITNAVLDYTTGFALKDSEDIDLTVAVIKSINDLCCTVEPFTDVLSDFRRISNEIKMPLNAAEASALSCVAVAIQTNARIIVIPTVTGRTVRALLSLKPCCIIIAISPSTRCTRLLSTYRSVVPLTYKGPFHRRWHKNVNVRIKYAIEFAVKKQLVDYAEMYVSLHKGSCDSSFCDTVGVWTVAIMKKTNIQCDGEETET